MVDQLKEFRQIIFQISNIWNVLVPKLPSFFLIFFMAVLFYSIFFLIKGNTPTLYVLTFSISLFSCGGAFYYLYDHKTLDTDTVLNVNIINFKIFIIVFVIAITFILLILHNIYYVKPYEYYVLVGIAAVSISLQIGLKKEVSNNEAFIIFLQIFSLAIIIRASSLFLSPFHIGVDTHHHYSHILKIIQSGHLNRSAFHYFYYPCSHLIHSIAGLIIGFSIASFKLINLCNSLVLIPIGYLIGSHVCNKKSGLMCALLFSLSTMNLFVVLFSTSKVGGATLLILVLYILLKVLHSSSTKYLLLFFICTLSSFLWHPEISASLLFILVAYSFTKLLNYNRLKLDSLLLLYFIFHVSYNIFVSTQIFNKIVKSILFIDVSHDSELIQNFVSNSTNMGLIFQLFAAYLGISIPFFFVIYILFSWIQKGNFESQFLMFSFFAVCFIPVIGVFSNNMSLNPTRLLTYVSLISLMITSYSLFNVFKLKSKKSVLLFSILILIFSIFSVSSYLAADGSEVYNDQIPVRVIFTTHSNIAAVTFIDSKLPNDAVITADPTTFDVSKMHRKGIRSYDLNSTGYVLVNNYHIKRQNLILDDCYIPSQVNQIYTNDFNKLEIIS